MGRAKEKYWIDSAHVRCVRSSLKQRSRALQMIADVISDQVRINRLLAEKQLVDEAIDILESQLPDD